MGKDTSMKPFWTMSQMSTLDGSPKLERQVQKLGLQAAQKTARISAAGYFYITRNTITRVFGMSLLFIFLLVKFDRLERSSMMASILPTMIPTTATPNSGQLMVVVVRMATTVLVAVFPIINWPKPYVLQKNVF